MSPRRAAPAWNRRSAATAVLRGLLLRALDDARAQFAGGAPDAAAIHRFRRSIKRARALIQLLRGAVERRAAAAMRQELADITGPWGLLRDAQVSQGLLEEFLGPAATGATRRRSTERARTRQLARLSRRRLADCGLQVECWSIEPLGWAVVGKAVGRAWHRARVAMPPDIPGATPQALHRWRRRVKTLQNELLVLTPLHDETVLRLLRDLDRLGHLLGCEHDLAVLAARLRRGELRPAAPVSRRSLLAAIRNERRLLRAPLRELGNPLFAHTGQQFERRLHRRWRAWQALGTRGAGAEAP